MDQNNNIKVLIEKLLETTIKLVEIDKEKKPIGVASGFILKRYNKNVLISAGHCFRGSKQMAIETSIIFGVETLLFALPPVNLVKKGDLKSNKFKDLDIAWVNFDPKEINNPHKDDDRLKGLKIELPAYLGPINNGPDPARPYAFASWSQCEFHSEKKTLVRDAVYEVGMKYIGMDSEKEIYKFKLAREHQGHKFYKGASGSPIADEEGRIISILLGGNDQQNIIYGFPIKNLAEIIESHES